MRLTVLTFKGAPPPSPIQVEFGPQGGSIGREPGNHLVLPDPERHISRLHAQVLFDGSAFVIEDHGGNPTLINGRPVGRGNRQAINDGDTLSIGGYELRAEASRSPAPFVTPVNTPTVASDPLGLFGGAPSSDPFATPTPVVPQAQAAAPAAPADDPFAVFMAAAPAPPPATRPEASLPDPFAAPPPPPKPAVPLGMDLSLAPAASVDDLFRLGPQGSASDPFAGTALSAHSAPAAPTANASDPLALFGAAPAPGPTPAPLRDDAPMLAENFAPPRPLPAAADTIATAPAPASAPKPSTADGQVGPGIVVSWTESPLPPTPPIQPPPADSSERVVPNVAASPGVSVRIEPALEAPAPAAAKPAPAAPVAPVAAPPASVRTAPDELLAAFQRGLGFPLQLPQGMTPDRMEQIGRVLRESVSGTMALLTARALTKREIRAEVTMIVSKENNPLKFAPDVEFALVQLLAPQGHGFMEPVKAMRDAYDDLRSHQFGFMAGMRAALSGVLERFKPEQLEGRISDRGFLDNVLPGSRKARLWDLYEQHYADISREAEDDFQNLFGRAFLRAYEEQIDRLASEPGRD